MKAITVEPLKAGSARLEEVPEPDVREGSVLVEAIAVGVCGTDVEIAEGKYGWAPPGHDRLILGHESLGRVIDPGLARGLKAAVMLLNPARIVIGGGFSKAGDALFVPLRTELRRQVTSWSKARLDIVPAELGDDSVLWGALELARDVRGGKR